MFTRGRFTLPLAFISLLLASIAADSDPVLGVALNVAAADDLPAPEPKVVPHRAPMKAKKTHPAVEEVEISDGIDLDADLKAIEKQHAKVEAASARTEAAMNHETHRAAAIQRKKQDLMIPDAEMAMITRNSSMGLVLLKHRDTKIEDLQKGLASLQSEVEKIQSSNSALSGQLAKVDAEQKKNKQKAKEVDQLETKQQNLQNQLGELLATSKTVERDSVTAAIREGESAEDTTQKDALLIEENKQLVAQNAVLKKQITAQLRELKTKRQQVAKGGRKMESQATERTRLVQALRNNQTRLQKERALLQNEDAKWRRRAANLKPLEAKVYQEEGRETKLLAASQGLQKNLRKAQMSLAGLTQSKLEATQQRLDKEEVLLKADKISTEKKILKDQAQMRAVDKETAKLQKQLKLARAGRLRRVVDGERAKRMAKANQKLRASVNALTQKLKKVNEQNAKLGAVIAEASSDADQAEASF